MTRKFQQMQAEERMALAAMKLQGMSLGSRGIEALNRKPNTSRKKAGEQIHSYLLRELTIDRPDQVWAACEEAVYMRLAVGQAVLPLGLTCERLAADLLLDLVQRADAPQRLGGCLRFSTPMASANSPVGGHPKLPQARTADYEGSVLRARRLAASLSHTNLGVLTIPSCQV